ncbi:MAG: hypothetical protein L0G87_03630 [Renibacterium salmoninarum]|nr:hypothetical protein [Renibacterium salmoninarum]
MTRLKKIHPGTWLGGIFLSIMALGVIFIRGAISGGWHIRKTCMAAGEIYDEDYRSQNWQEPTQIFPMHNKCNASYDLVPFWINPALVFFALLALICLTLLILASVQRAKTRRAESLNHEKS